LRKTVICKFYEQNECLKSDNSCGYAHGDAQLKPLPKYEMCKKHQNKKCNLDNTEVCIIKVVQSRRF